MKILETWECHPKKCDCINCNPSSWKELTAGGMPSQAMFLSLGPDDSPPEGWVKIRKI